MQGRLAGIYPDMGVPAHWWGSSQAQKSIPGSHQTSCCVLMVGWVGSLQGLWNRGMMTKLPLPSCFLLLAPGFCVHVFQGTASRIQKERDHYPGEVNSSGPLGLGGVAPRGVWDRLYVPGQEGGSG